MSDLSATVSLSGLSELHYDDATGLLYATSFNTGLFYRWSPATGAFLSSVNLAGVTVNGAPMNDLTGFGITADGQFALVSPSLATQGYVNEVDRIDLSNLTFQRFNIANGIDEQGGSIAITSTGVALDATAFQSSSPFSAPLREYHAKGAAISPSTVSLVAGPTGLGNSQVGGDTVLVASEHNRYVLVEETAFNTGDIEVYDSAVDRIISQATNVGPGQVYGSGDISEAAGLLAVITTNGTGIATSGAIKVFDLNLNVVHDLSSLTAGARYGGAHFSADGHQLYLLNVTADTIDVYDTSLWTKVGSTALQTPITNATIYEHQNMTTSLDGKLLFVATGPGFEVVDLSHDLSLTVQGDSTHTVLYGAVGNDTITGSAANDTLDGGGGNDTLTGGLGADTFVFKPGYGDSVITDFSDAQGDRLDLTAFSGLHGLTDVLAIASQSGPNTVISLPGGGSVTLDNVQKGSLTASDVLVLPIQIPTSGSVVTINSGEVVSATSGSLAYYTANAGGTLINNGAMSLIAASSTNAIITSNAPDPTALFENNGSFTYQDPNGAAVEYVTVHNTGTMGITFTQAGQGFTGDLTNAGAITIQAGTGAFGVYDANLGALVQNQVGATLSVSATNGPADGIEVLDGGEVDNAGALTVSSTVSSTVSVGVTAYDSIFDGPGYSLVNNSGTITVNSPAGYGVYLLAGRAVPSGLYNLINTGTITAQVAVDSSLFATPAAVNNSGTLNGAVQFDIGNNVLLNTGTINGSIHLGSGGDTLSSSGGTINGTITLGYGDTVTLGGENNTVVMGSGADSVNGGGGVNTVSYANAASGVTVSLGLQGSAQNTIGAGTDTLSNFQNLTGSAFNDTLQGDGNNNVLDGGGGVNTVSYANATAGVTVSLALQGSAQNTVGAGVDTLNNFQNLTGSAYNDTLTGDANNNVIDGGAGFDRIIGSGGADTLTGGLGADTFVFGPNIGQTVITDFTHSDGDQIDLSAFNTFHSLFDVLEASTQVGANTVITLGSGTLTLDNVQMTHLGGSDFGLPEPVYTTQIPAVYAGLYRSYYVHADSTYDFYGLPAPASGLAGTGYAIVLGSSGLANNLVNPQQLSFVDGFLATGTSTSAAQVYRIYGATLDRQPDSEGLANWVHSLAGGMSLQTVVNGFVGSDEFQAKYGALDNNGFVTLLYNNVLGRGPDAGGLANWLSYLSQGHSRAEVVLGFSESPEYIADTALPVLQGLWVTDTGAAEVARLYDTVLGRLPDSVGEINWTHALDGGAMTLLQVTQGFVGSAEFQAVYGSVNDSQFVQLLYQNTLHRAADAQGLTNWVNYLGSGHSRAEVVQGFSESQEHINNTAAHIDDGIWYL